MKNLFLTSSLLMLCVLWSGSSAQTQAMDPIEELKNCARTEDPAVRSVCYEDLGNAVLEAQDSVVPVSAEVEAPDEELPDSIGGGKFAQDAGVKAPSNSGLVKSCQKAADRKWFYIFENGQVWKQVDDRRRRHKDCNFNAIITKDSFGYIMRIEGEKGKIRIKRHQ